MVKKTCSGRLNEVFQHISFCQNKCGDFHGGDNMLQVGFCNLFIRIYHDFEGGWDRKICISRSLFGIPMLGNPSLKITIWHHEAWKSVPRDHHLASFVLLEHLAMLLTSTLAINC